MNQEWKTKWVEALRSGKYKQGKMQLRVVLPDGEPGFCCLGVACDITNTGSWVDETNTEFGGFTMPGTGEAPYCAMPPNAIKAKYGVMYWSVPTIEFPEHLRSKLVSMCCGGGHLGCAEEMLDLVEINDSGLFDFNEIADIIEVCGVI